MNAPIFPRRSASCPALPKRVMTALRRCLSAADQSPSVLLVKERGLHLADLLHSLQEALAALPPLPAGEDGEVRLLALARDLVGDGACSADALLRGLSMPCDPPWTAAERLSLPVLTALACAEQLSACLETLCKDARARRDGQILAARMPRMSSPLDALTHRSVSGVFLFALREALADAGQDLLISALDAWLADQGSSAAELARRYAARQLQQCDAIRTACTAIEHLMHLDWQETCTRDDPLHALLMTDPAGVYPGMMPRSRADMRLQLEALARLFRLMPLRLAEEVLLLCREAEPRSLESHVGYWLLDPEGISALRRQCGTRHGRPRVFLWQHRQEAFRSMLWFCSIAAGFGFLQARQPLWLLPFFLAAAGQGIRALLSGMLRPSPLPAMAHQAVTKELRTLVVLPVTLRDAHEAIAMLRLLKTSRHAFPDAGVDFLLLGDYAPARALRLTEDAALCAAAVSAVEALNREGQGQFMYLQRRRIWEADKGRFAARNGRTGALQALCRLIAQGECEDLLDAATIAPATLHRAYAFILTLTPDIRPAPGMLEALLAAAAHPLQTRCPVPGGWRGYTLLTPQISGDPAPLSSVLRALTHLPQASGYEGVGLIRPDAFLMATDGLLPDIPTGTCTLAGELAGCMPVSGASAIRDLPVNLHQRLDAAYRRTRDAWRPLMWLFPWVQTPTGFLRAPIDHRSRFRLREAMREGIVPPAQTVLLAFALLTGNIPLMLITLILPEVSCFRSPGKAGMLRFLARTALLPLRGCVRALAVFDGVRPLFPGSTGKDPDRTWSTLEIWAQGIAATVCLAAAIAIPGMWGPGLLLGGLFAGFPFLHRWLDTPLPAPAPLADEDRAFLTDAARATWHYFCQQVTEERRSLPLCAVQFDPPLAPEPETGPEAIAAFMLACVSARELGFIGVPEAADQLARTLYSLKELPMPDGLPCRRYALPALTIADPTVDSAACGLLLAALMTCAQAVRTWLPACRPDQLGLPAALDAFAARLDIRRLYDDSARLFCDSLDADGQGRGLTSFVADERLVLSVAAVAQRIVPPEHLRHLSGTFVRSVDGVLPLSRHGDAAAYLLPGLFLPTDPLQASEAVRMQQLRGMEGIFGLAGCAVWDIFPDMRFRRMSLGLPELAAESLPHRAVFSAFAAALTLPAAPDAAAKCLRRMQEKGMLRDQGFCEALDMSLRGPQGEMTPRPVGLYDTLHQGILLCAMAHVLADAPIRRYFTALPQVEATLPLLRLSERPRHVLPAGFHPVQPVRRDPLAFSREAMPHAAVPDAHLLGSAAFSLLTDANGCSCLRCGKIPLTRFDADPGMLSGMQCCLADEGRVFRVTDELLPGTTVFSAGTVRYERRCGSLRTHLTVAVDPGRQRALHLLEVTNLSTADRVIEVSGCLLPDLAAASDTLEARRLADTHLAVHCRKSGQELHQRIVTSAPPLMLSACTDRTAFLGRGRTLHAPASLEEPMADLTGPTMTPCLSLRAQMTLGGRGQIAVLFVTGITDAEAPALDDLPGLFALAGMQGRAIAEAAHAAPPQETAASLMAGPLGWSPSGTCIAVELLTCDGLPLLEDVLAAAGMLRMKGLDASVRAVCPEALHAAVREAFHAALLPEDRLSVTEQEPDTACLVLREDGGPLIGQLSALYRPLPVPETDVAPIPAALPKEDVRHPGGYGGFDRETDDYLLCLSPGQTTPAPWENVHLSPRWRERADETGFREPFYETLRLRQEDGTVIDPFAPGLPRIMQQGAGFTEWNAWTDALDITLTACCMPGFPAGLRVLRIQNATDTPLTLTVQTAARLSREGKPTLLPGMAAQALSGQNTSACLAGLTDGWEAALCRVLPDSGGRLHILLDEQGDRALLTCILPLAAQGNAEAVWLCGTLDHLEQAEQAALLLREDGASALLRQVRQEWTHRLSALTISTPEDTLDLLFNRILPLQCRTGTEDGLPLPDVVPALAVTAPDEARAALLASAGQVHDRAGYFLLTLAAAQYVRITGDAAVLQAPMNGGTLLQCCREALLSLPLDARRLPEVSAPAPCAFMAAAAADALHELTRDEALRELSQELRNAADTHLWSGTRYGQDKLSLSSQSWAALADGPNHRTKQALSAAWASLYDEEHGLLRQRLPEEQGTPLPGTPHNGGQDTRQAVWAMMALSRLHERERTWTLLRALNPIHHTDDPLRTEVWQAAPWSLHGGVDAAPAQAGRAHGDGTAAAGWLYIALLEDLLGFRLRGDRVQLAPFVPEEWDGFTLTLRHGTSTWHFSLERGIEGLLLDGTAHEGDSITLADDGRVHQVRFPL